MSPEERKKDYILEVIWIAIWIQELYEGFFRSVIFNLHLIKIQKSFQCVLLSQRKNQTKIRMADNAVPQGITIWDVFNHQKHTSLLFNAIFTGSQLPPHE